jgi:hypothetical protein
MTHSFVCLDSCVFVTSKKTLTIRMTALRDWKMNTETTYVFVESIPLCFFFTK